MVVTKRKPKETAKEQLRNRFVEALKARIAKDHPSEHGQANWLFQQLKAYTKKHGLPPPVSAQACGYWLRGEKMPSHENMGMICDALGISRDVLFGDDQDQRLMDIAEAWEQLPDATKNIIHAAAVAARYGKSG